MKLTKQMIDDKLKQIAIHEKRFGESTKSRAIKKYCLDKEYKKRVDQFTQASLNTIKHYQYAKYTEFNQNNSDHYSNAFMDTSNV